MSGMLKRRQSFVLRKVFISGSRDGKLTVEKEGGVGKGGAKWEGGGVKRNNGVYTSG